MRYSLLPLLSCVSCNRAVVSIPGKEMEVSENGRETEVQYSRPQARIDGPRSETAALSGFFPAPIQAEHRRPGDHLHLAEGILVCPSCKRFFPVKEFIPELLPDHLRNQGRDLEFLHAQGRLLPEPFLNLLESEFRKRMKKASDADDPGRRYKVSEMTIQEKILDPRFFGPGVFSPFHPQDPESTSTLINRFGAVLPLLELKCGDHVLDVGCGYFWTTEWLRKMGVVSVGLDISRVYLEVGLKRTGYRHPHLVIGDVENLPIRDNLFHAVLTFNSFHHVPDRKKAMRGFARILRPEGMVVLAEPGKDHARHPDTRDVVRKYGILEKGMTLKDLEGYTAGLGFQRPLLQGIFRLVKAGGKPWPVDIRKNVGGPIYTIRKGTRERGQRWNPKHFLSLIRKYYFNR